MNNSAMTDHVNMLFTLYKEFNQYFLQKNNNFTYCRDILIVFFISMQFRKTKVFKSATLLIIQPSMDHYCRQNRLKLAILKYW